MWVIEPQQILIAPRGLTVQRSSVFEKRLKGKSRQTTYNIEDLIERNERNEFSLFTIRKKRRKAKKSEMLKRRNKERGH